MSKLLTKSIILSRIKNSEVFIKRIFCNSNYEGDVLKDNILKNTLVVDIPKVSIPEFVFSQCEEFSDLIQYECPISKRSYTFREVRIRSKNMSKMLRNKLQLTKGDVVLILLPNLPEFPIVTLGCLTAGIIASTANCQYSADEIAKQVIDSGAKAIVTTCDFHSLVVKASKLTQSKLPIICIKTMSGQCLPQGAIDFEQLSTTELDIPDLEPPNSDDIAILPYSSGTTGLPKGVKLSHFNIVANLVQNLTLLDDIIYKASGSHQEVTPGVLPMFHIYGFTFTTLLMMLKGVKVLPLTKFSPDTYIQTLKDYNPNLLFTAPTLILFLTLHPGVHPKYLRNVRVTFCGAAPLGTSDEERFIEKVNQSVLLLQGYGLTETSPVVAMNTSKIKANFRKVSQGSVGQVLPNTEAKIVKLGEPTATSLGPLETGELLVRGPQVMQGYHNNAKGTEDIFLDGWLRTGDLAHYNKHGFIFITDRVKELIKVKGFQVAPAELEELLRNHPKVAEAAVIGIPNMISGEVPRAYIHLKQSTNADDINRFINDKVAKYKRLEGGIEFVKEIPKSSTGKILRRLLKEQYLQEHQL